MAYILYILYVPIYNNTCFPREPCHDTTMHKKNKRKMAYNLLPFFMHNS